MYQIGIDIGGTNVKLGLLDEALELTAEASIPFPHTTAADMANTLAEGNYLLYNRYVRDTDPAEVLSLYGQQRFDLAEKYLDYELIDSKDEVIASDLPEEEHAGAGADEPHGQGVQGRVL